MTRDDTLAAMVRTLIQGDLSVIDTIFDRVEELNMPHLYRKFHTALGELFAVLPTKAESLQDRQHVRETPVSVTDITEDNAIQVNFNEIMQRANAATGRLLTLPEGYTVAESSENFDPNEMIRPPYEAYHGYCRRAWKKFLNSVTRIFWCQLMTLPQWVERTTLAVPAKLRDTMGTDHLRSVTDE